MNDPTDPCDAVPPHPADDDLPTLDDGDPYATVRPKASNAPGAPRAAVAGYEILAELGRGGMGVVYRARQAHLHREVALKMILSGDHAGEEDRLRFLAEAEAVAAVQHPGIVQVFDFGTHDGLPYFALEYCPGGSLADRLRAGPLPPGEAARVVEQVARAMQAAHGRGIVHRDLKPANVLLGADDAPKVTDFGLAKRVEGGSGLTQTGATLGTPAYMAPEQAEGKKDVGPPADVWAMGVILYECLTGRPPFLAATVYDILSQVVADEPVPPTRLLPRVPRDLETVCLKCLHKSPEARYASAAALADDLARWRGGEPILARPAGTTERALKWARRRPAVAAMAALTLAAGVALVGITVVALQQRQAAVDALARADRAQRERALAQVNALRDASPGAVPALLAALRDGGEGVLPRLRELYAAEKDRAGRARLALALVSEDDAARAEVAGWLRRADDPAEVLLARDALSPFADELTEGLWATARDGRAAPAERFRALVALAAYDPDSPRWRQSGAVGVGQLLSANPLHLGTWVQGLRPVRVALLGPLGDVFRGKNGVPAAQKHVAAQVLADYAADRPEVLADLLLDADPEQDALLLPVLARQRERALERLRAERSARPDYWRDGPADPAWRQLPDGLRRAVEEASGLLADRWALCQSLPLARLAEVTEGLRPCGYRPTRVRPWRLGDEVRVAVVWTRDGRAWKLETGLTDAEVKRRDAEQVRAGLIAEDIAEYETSQDYVYSVLWRRADRGEKADVHLGVLPFVLGARVAAYKAGGMVPHALQVYPGDIDRYAGVWRKGEASGPWCVWWGDPPRLLADRVAGGEKCILDVSVAGSKAAATYASVWHHDEAREATGLHGLTPEAHLARCRELAAAGWRPAALSLAPLPGQKVPVAASAWHRPVRLAEQESLARRQAVAAATLLRLGDPEPAWPAFRHAPDPTARSYLVEACALRGVDARLLVGRLDREEDASSRRALVVALGDYPAKDLPADVRGPLVEKLLGWYRDDPDAGVHGAIDWLLRHAKEGPAPRPIDWGQAEALGRIDRELATKTGSPPRGPKAARAWRVNGQGQTFTRFQGPVEFRMGSPVWEPGHAQTENPHVRRIARSFELATRAVTVAQWRRFLKDRPAVGLASPNWSSPEGEGPISSVTMYEAMAYCNWLSETEGIPEGQWCYPRETGPGMKPFPDYLKRTGYRLPTEAEWEYACRAGSSSSRYYGTSTDLLRRYAWYQRNSNEGRWPVGQKRPNDSGLFDMHGNVWTWCQNRDTPNPSGRVDDEGDASVVDDRGGRSPRGGSTLNDVAFVRSSKRVKELPPSRTKYLGLRVGRTSP